MLDMSGTPTCGGIPMAVGGGGVLRVTVTTGCKCMAAVAGGS
jgi:hypothetical protein